MKRERDWSAIVSTVNELMAILKRKPCSAKLGVQLSPGGILNGYREGDLTFNQAVKKLQHWKKRP